MVAGAYSGGLLAKPSVGSRGKAPGQGVSPSEAENNFKIEQYCALDLTI